MTGLRTRGIVVLVLSMVGIVATPPLRAGAATVAASLTAESTSSVAPAVHATFTNATITATGTSTLGFTMNESGHSMSLQVAPAPGVEVLTAGTYTGLQSLGAQSAGHLGVAFSGDGQTCATPSGDAQLDDVEVDDGPVLLSFAGRFALHCGGGVVFVAVTFASATVEPAFTVDRPSIDFGTARQWYGATPTVVEFTNTSGSTVQVGSLSSDSDQIALSNDNCSNAELFAGWSCLFEVNSAPKRFGPVHATVTVPSDMTTIGGTAGYSVHVDFDVVEPQPGHRFAEYSFGATNVPPGDILVGDFDEDGLDDLFDYRPGTASDGLFLATGDGASTGRFFRRTPFTVNGTYQTELGDFDGDGHLDVLFYAPGTTPDAIWYGRGNGTFTKVAYTVNGRFEPVVSDLDSNATTDILWYGPGRATDVEWRFGTDRRVQSVPVTINGTYDFVTGGDFNDDGRSDLLFWNHAALRHPVWMSQGASSHSVVSFPTPSAGAIPLVMNADGDTVSDILWYNAGPATDALALGDQGNTQLLPLRLNGDYSPLVANFDGDDAGLDDIVWWASAPAPDRFWSDGLTNVAFAEFNRWDPRTHEVVGGYFDDDETVDLVFLGHGDAPVWTGYDVDGPDASQFRSRSSRFRSR